MCDLIKNITTIILLINTKYCFAEQSKQNSLDLLMKGLYEHEKRADYQTDSEGKRKSEEYVKQYEKMQKLKSAIEEEKERVEIYEEALKISQEKAKSSPGKDMTHEVEDRVMDKYKVSRSEAHKMIQNYDPRAEEIWQAMVKTETEKELQAAKKRIEERKQHKNKK